MSARRTNARKVSIPGLERLRRVPRKSLAIVGIVSLVAFVAGYALTTVAFSATSALSDVALVPDIRGLTVDRAIERLEDDGLLLVVGDSFPNASAPEGSILAQSPLPGQEVSGGTEVSIILSTGQPKEIVPDVTTMELPLAIRTLEAAGFEVMAEEAEGGGPVGTVVEILPTAGTAAPLPAVVVLRVATSPAFWYMPDVVGLSEDSAVIALESTGLKVSELRYESIAGLPPYRVAAQLPLPGDSVDVNSFVRVLVSLPVVESPGGGPVDGEESVGEPAPAAPSDGSGTVPAASAANPTGN